MLDPDDQADAKAPDDVGHDHARHSVGGQQGHIARRVFHVGMVAIPWVWYWHAGPIEAAFGQPRDVLLLALLTLGVALELVRRHQGWTIFGQRAYEAHQFSALAWGMVSVGLTLLFAPMIGERGAAIGVPIIWSLSLVDPLMGELRRAGKPDRVVAATGVCMTAAVWLTAGWLLGGPLWPAAIMAPLTVAAEWPRLRWIDDNATMTLAPLAAALALAPWLS
jgi:hypothetical protein